MFEAMFRHFSQQISQRLSSTRRKANSLTSIFTLPTELLEDVLYRAVVQNEEVQLQKVYSIASVCSRWWSVIKSCPRFWTLINVGSKAMELALQRSGRLPVHLVWHPAALPRNFRRPSITPEQLDLLLLQSTRCRKLTCDVQLFHEWNRFLDRPLPLMKKLVLCCSSKAGSSVLPLPSIKICIEKLHILRCWISGPFSSWLELSALKTLGITNIQTPIDVHSFFHTLLQCTELEALSIECVQFAIPQDTMEMPASEPIVLSSLDHLFIRSLSTFDTCNLINTLVTPKLQKFVLIWYESEQDPETWGEPQVDLLKALVDSHSEDAPLQACLWDSCGLVDIKLVNGTDFFISYAGKGLMCSVNLFGSPWLTAVEDINQAILDFYETPIRLRVINNALGPININHSGRIPETRLLEAFHASLEELIIEDGNPDTVHGIIKYMSSARALPPHTVSEAWPCHELSYFEIKSPHDTVPPHASETMALVEHMVERRSEGYVQTEEDLQELCAAWESPIGERVHPLSRRSQVNVYGSMVH